MTTTQPGTYSLTQLFNDPRLDDIIKNFSSGKNDEYQLSKAELFYILCEGDKVEKISSYDQQIYYCIRILKNTIHSTSSPYWKQFKNGGLPKKCKSESIEDKHHLAIEEDDIDYKMRDVVDKINHILNTELPWYEAHIFRLYYIPFPDPHCEKETYSMRDIERLHTYGEYRIDHVAIHHKLKKTFTFILKRLKENGDITAGEIKNMKAKNIFQNI